VNIYDQSKITRLRFYGTDWAGGGDDFIDVKNFKIVPPMGYSSLNKIVGNQLTGAALNKFNSDTIEVWDNAGTASAYRRAWYKTGTTNS